MRLGLALALACALGACRSAPEADAACTRSCDTEWEGCYTGADQRHRACEKTCGGGDACRARCRQAHPLWKDHCDERHEVCLDTCRSRGR